MIQRGEHTSGAYWHTASGNRVADWFSVLAITDDAWLIAYLPTNCRTINALIVPFSEVSRLPAVLRKAGCRVDSAKLLVQMMQGLVPRYRPDLFSQHRFSMDTIMTHKPKWRDLEAKVFEYITAQGFKLTLDEFRNPRGGKSGQKYIGPSLAKLGALDPDWVRLSDEPCDYDDTLWRGVRVWFHFCESVAYDLDDRKSCQEMCDFYLSTMGA